MIALLLLLFSLHLRTKAGRDHQARVMGDNASNATGSYATGSWLAVSSSSAAADENNTTLPGEISSGTLARAQAVYAHTTGTNFYTLTKVFTTDQTVTIRKCGVFNAATGGTLCFESPVADVSLRSGDQFQLTEVITL